MPGAGAVREALQQVPFIVSFASYMDETAVISDLILPNHAHLERWDDVPVTAGYNRPLIGLAQTVVAPQQDTMHTGDVFLQLAAALGGSLAASLAWEDYGTCLQDGYASHWADLEENGYWLDRSFEPETWSFAFPTPSGKFEFSASMAISKPYLHPSPPKAMTAVIT